MYVCIYYEQIDELRYDVDHKQVNWESSVIDITSAEVGNKNEELGAS